MDITSLRHIDFDGGTGVLEGFSEYAIGGDVGGVTNSVGDARGDVLLDHVGEELGVSESAVSGVVKEARVDDA